MDAILPFRRAIVVQLSGNFGNTEPAQKSVIFLAIRRGFPKKYRLVALGVLGCQF